MFSIKNFLPQLITSLPETYALLKSANLTVHPSVSRIILHGSRGLAGNHRPDSDIDLSLIVDTPKPEQANLEKLLHEVFEVTWQNWRAVIKPDLAVIFDARNCELKCFDQTAWHDQICKIGGVDCFGLYKVQKGFNGLVTNAGVRVKRMYPCLKIWQRP